MERKAYIAKIHILKKTLGLDEDTYRGVLLRETGKPSCSLFTNKKEFTKVLNALNPKMRYGMQRVPFENGVGLPSVLKGISVKQWFFALILWKKLEKCGMISNGNEEALQAYITKRYPNGVNTYTMGDIIEQLKQWLERGK